MATPALFLGGEVTGEPGKIRSHVVRFRLPACGMFPKSSTFIANNPQGGGMRQDPPDRRDPSGFLGCGEVAPECREGQPIPGESAVSAFRGRWRFTPLFGALRRLIVQVEGF